MKAISGVSIAFVGSLAWAHDRPRPTYIGNHSDGREILAADNGPVSLGLTVGDLGIISTIVLVSTTTAQPSTVTFQTTWTVSSEIPISPTSAIQSATKRSSLTSSASAVTRTVTVSNSSGTSTPSLATIISSSVVITGKSSSGAFPITSSHLVAATTYVPYETTSVTVSTESVLLPSILSTLSSPSPSPPPAYILTMTIVDGQITRISTTTVKNTAFSSLITSASSTASTYTAKDTSTSSQLTSVVPICSTVPNAVTITSKEIIYKPSTITIYACNTTATRRTSSIHTTLPFLTLQLPSTESSPTHGTLSSIGPPTSIASPAMTFPAGATAQLQMSPSLSWGTGMTTTKVTTRLTLTSTSTSVPKNGTSATRPLTISTTFPTAGTTRIQASILVSIIMVAVGLLA
ncbi:hypothetical protein B0O99DRAFT_741658 [Bisporella sp. PMI_857]|nr:hypothetical protein B0O99DRAFT_741658 [Bisporella sp. PMI_857]